MATTTTNLTELKVNVLSKSIFDGLTTKSNDEIYLVTDAPFVSGVKGNAETSYRTGQVNLTPANIGALALSGGTMTGAINSSYTSSSWIASCKEQKSVINVTGTSYTGWISGKTKDGFMVISTYPGSNNNLYFGYMKSTTTSNSLDSSMTWDGSTGTLNTTIIKGSRLIATTETDAAHNSGNAVALITGNATGTHLEFDGNEIFAKTSATAAGTLYIQSGSGNTEISSGGTTTIGTNSVFKNGDPSINVTGRVDMGCLRLTNDGWTGYGTGNPAGSLTNVLGRVYFKVI